MRAAHACMQVHKRELHLCVTPVPVGGTERRERQDVYWVREQREDVRVVKWGGERERACDGQHRGRDIRHETVSSKDEPLLLATAAAALRQGHIPEVADNVADGEVLQEPGVHELLLACRNVAKK